MPLYCFQNKKGQAKDFFFTMSAAPSIGEEIEIEGAVWTRVPSLPNATIDGSIDPFNTQQIMEKTNKKGTMGGLFDRAKELSEKRAAKAGGKDPVQEKWFKEYAAKRQGKKHPKDR